MAEMHQRCHYWPNCTIHLGKHMPRNFSEASADEMCELFESGERVQDIAQAFDTTADTVSRIIRRKTSRP